MSHKSFRALTDELLSLAGAADSDELYATVNLTVDGVSFSLMHGGAEDEGSIVMFCDFGVPPAERNAKVVKALLVANIAAFDSAGRESFCMNHASGHVLASSVLPMRNASGQLFLELLRHYAAQAKRWQDIYFFGMDSETLAAAHASNMGKMSAVFKSLLDG